MGASRSEAFRRLVEKDPGNAMVLYSLGGELFKEGRNEEAAVYLRRAVEAKPDYSAAYRSLGRALATLGKREEAFGIFRRGREVALGKGDLQIAREIDVFVKRLERGGAPADRKE